MTPETHRNQRNHRIDYHIHTDFSMDCKVPMREQCAAAVQAGLTEIAFTEHLNNHMLDLDLGFYRADAYFTALEDCRAAFPNLTIRAGVEVGEPHRYARKVRPILERFPYDVVLGSVHWVGNDYLFHDSFYQRRTHTEAYHLYFQEVRTMIEAGGFDVVAHVDLPKRISVGIYGSYDPAPYADDINAVWAACVKHNIAVEINTKALRNTVAEQHPSASALGWYAAQGGTLLTFGSDAHQTAHVGYGFDVAARVAASAGLTQVCRFEHRKRIEMVEVERSAVAEK